MLAIFLFVLYLCLVALFLYAPKNKALAQQEVIKIVTAIPNGEPEKAPILAVEVNLGNGTPNPSTNSGVFTTSTPLPNSQGNGTNTYRENSPRTLAPLTQDFQSERLVGEGSLATALGDNISPNLSNNEETRQNLHFEEAPNPEKEALMYDKNIINEAVHKSRLAVVKKIQEFVENKSYLSGAYKPLYDLLTDYPFRLGKMLRPTICVSVARAVGGMGHSALTSASALELYHNAFLIHDDIEDGSASRRGQGTLHQMIGIPRAINVGDATNVLAVGLLLENLSVIGVSKALDVLHEIEFMAQQSVEGQAMELDWIAMNSSNLTDQDYFKMCVKKTCWYSFITPCRIGLIVGHPSVSNQELVKNLGMITRFGMILGIAFQIQDDLLNLQGQIEAYGKEIGGDICEGKRTLMLNHVLAHSGQAASERILEILALPRENKSPEQLAFIVKQMRLCGSIEHGGEVARSLANQAAEIFDKLDFLQPATTLRPEEQWECPVHDRRFLKELINYVIYRNV